MINVKEPALLVILTTALFIGLTSNSYGETIIIYGDPIEDPWTDSDDFHNRIDADRKRRANKEHRPRQLLGGGGGGGSPSNTDSEKKKNKKCKEEQNSCLSAITKTIANCNNTYNTQNEQLLNKGLACHGQSYQEVASDAWDQGWFKLSLPYTICKVLENFNDIKKIDECFEPYKNLGMQRCANGIPEITKSSQSSFKTGLVFKIVSGDFSQKITTKYRDGEGSLKICGRIKNEATPKCANAYNQCME